MISNDWKLQNRIFAKMYNLIPIHTGTCHAAHQHSSHDHQVCSQVRHQQKILIINGKGT